LKVVKVRLYPNKLQKQAIHKTFGSCRFVYNILLDAKIKAYECGDNVSAYELKKRLVPMKKANGGEFLKQVDSTALQNAVLKIDIAYKNFFRRVKLGEKAGFPRFKSKHNSYQSYQSSTASIKVNKLYLPKIGEVKAKFHRGKITDKIKTVTVSYEAGQYPRKH
jgi:putative transposase